MYFVLMRKIEAFDVAQLQTLKICNAQSDFRLWLAIQLDLVPPCKTEHLSTPGSIASALNGEGEKKEKKTEKEGKKIIGCDMLRSFDVGPVLTIWMQASWLGHFRSARSKLGEPSAPQPQAPRTQ
jgi:hypothetical protein